MSPRELLNTLVRNRWIVLGVFSTVVVLAALLTWLQVPTYESGASLRIDEKDGSSLALLGDLNPIAGGSGVLETEMLVLQSRQIAERVVDSLDLQVELAEPQVPRETLLQVLDAPRSVAAAVYELTRDEKGYAVRRVESTGPDRTAALPARVEVGRPFRLGDVTLSIDPEADASLPQTIRIQVHAFRSAVEALRRDVGVLRPNPDAQVVVVRYRSADPHLAAAVPNALTASFVEYKMRTSRTESGSTVEFLREQVESHERQLRLAESALRGFRERQQVVSPAEEASAQVRRLAELRAERDALRAERDALAQLLERIDGESPSASGRSPYRQLASFPVFLSNRAVQDILQSITALENQRAELLVRRTGENADIQGINQRVRELEMQLYQTARSYLQSLDSQLVSIDENLARFGDQLEEIPAREVEFARLLREQNLIEELYKLLQTRLKEAEIQNAVVPGSVRVIDPALVPLEPVSPRPVRNLALASVFGLVLGVVAAFGRQLLDTKVRGREDVEALTGGLPVVGVIPRMQMLGTNGEKRSNGKPRVFRVSPETLVEQRLITSEPRGPAAEAYRALRTSITFSSSERTPQVLVVTSAMPGDGKSTSSSNLAVTVAQQGTRTLLVDADLRLGVLHGVFNVSAEPGLTHVLLGRTKLEDAVREVVVPDSDQPLYLLPSGVRPPNPAELLGSDRMRRLMAELRERFEMVIFDAPPLNLVTDAALLGKHADATFLVTRNGITDKSALRHAAGLLHQLRVPVGGVVLNDLARDSTSYYGGYGYYGGNAAPAGTNGRSG